MKGYCLLVITALGPILVPDLETRAWACGPPVPKRLDMMAQQAISTNHAVSTAALSTLRAAGPEGLEALFRAHDSMIEKFLLERSRPGSDQEQATVQRLREALDSVGRQCDDYASRLYWYTDLDQAKVAAKAQSKPILSLRLLGNLDQEYSCANSRFFRTTLYPNAEVSKYLREHFILHWQTVRPVPRITIDFGDGRKIERTITGNSVHYVLDSQGNPIDALPGLYGPKAFLKLLASAEQTATQCAALNASQRAEYLRAWHSRARAEILRQWNEDTAATGGSATALSTPLKASLNQGVPSAQTAGKLAIAKSAAESPMLRSLRPGAKRPLSLGDNEVPEEVWARIAMLHGDDARLDARAESVVLSKTSSALQASQRAVSKRLVENPVLTTLRNLQRSIAEDTVRNEFSLHLQVHDWFVQGLAPTELPRLNAKVYAELFLMPETDPWLGLVPANTFTGLPNDGLVQNTN